MAYDSNPTPDEASYGLSLLARMFVAGGDKKHQAPVLSAMRPASALIGVGNRRVLRGLVVFDFIAARCS